MWSVKVVNNRMCVLEDMALETFPIIGTESSTKSSTSYTPSSKLFLEGNSGWNPEVCFGSSA